MSVHILVFEDEWESRQGLVDMLRAIRPGVQVYAAENGAQGLEILKSRDVDLVLLDIQMPDMNGLDVLETIRRLYGNLLVVIISAYDHFPYAQRAIRLGVFDYIVKPFSADTISRILEYVEAQRAGDTGPVTAQGVHLSSALYRWLNDPQRYAQSLGSQLHLSSTGGALILFRPIVASKEQHAFYAHAQSVVTTYLRNVLCAQLSDQGIPVVFPNADDIVVAVFSHPGQRLEAQALAFLPDCLHNVQLQFGVLLSAALSDNVEDLLINVQRAYQQAVALSEYSFYADRYALIARDHYESRINIQRRTDPNVFRALCDAIIEGDGCGAGVAVSGLFDMLVQPPWMPPQRLVYALHSCLTELLGRVANTLSASECAGFDERLHELVEYTGHIVAFRARVSDLCVSIADVVRAFSVNKNSAIMSRCIDYLSVHYSDPSLTQELIAGIFHFSPGYFGTLFKTATGQPFVRYLNNLRIEQARQMLEHSSCKVYTVAEKVGFSDVRYFIRVFKSHTGVSPNQYRSTIAIRKS